MGDCKKITIVLQHAGCSSSFNTTGKSSKVSILLHKQHYKHIFIAETGLVVDCKPHLTKKKCSNIRWLSACKKGLRIVLPLPQFDCLCNNTALCYIMLDSHLFKDAVWQSLRSVLPKTEIMNGCTFRVYVNCALLSLWRLNCCFAS